MVREGQKRGNLQYRTQKDNGGRKVYVNLSVVFMRHSLSGERDYDKQQTDQGSGRRRRDEVEIRPPFKQQF
jgi:hypothetical protein